MWSCSYCYSKQFIKDDNLLTCVKCYNIIDNVIDCTAEWRYYNGDDNISEDPSLPNGSGTRPYDSEGVLTHKKDIINEGILKTYLLDTYAARKLNETCTGNGVLTNILVTSKQPSSSLLESMPDGLYITDMMGSGANTLTGDYSRGAFGYLVKNGEIQYPVTEITVASNLLQMFENIIALGDDIDSRNRIRTGSMLIDNITIGGQ